MIIAWFSCGATSAVACKMALSMYNNVRIYYIETGSCHPDNVRFLKDCEQWYGRTIQVLQNPKYNCVADVLRNGWINSPYGAACTFELKKKIRYRLEKAAKIWDGQVWGFEYSQREINRAIRFKQQNPETKPLFPLIDKMITKEDAMEMIQIAGIELPAMYKLGYNNNNCIGCVKGGMGYWNKIRVDFPEQFKEVAEIEREVKATCIKNETGRVYLDELDPCRGDPVTEVTPDCSLFCQIEFQEILDRQTERILKGEMGINEVA